MFTAICLAYHVFVRGNTVPSYSTDLEFSAGLEMA